jgi:hypothetical protein
VTLGGQARLGVGLTNKETFGTIHLAGGETRSYKYKLICSLSYKLLNVNTIKNK